MFENARMMNDLIVFSEVQYDVNPHTIADIKKTTFDFNTMNFYILNYDFIYSYLNRKQIKGIYKASFINENLLRKENQKIILSILTKEMLWRCLKIVYNITVMLYPIIV